jgi:GDP-mannose 6-dehydrogenase
MSNYYGRVQERKMRIALFGLGYVGCVTAACLAKQGHTVVGADISTLKVEAFASGSSPIVEPSLPEMLGEAKERGLLSATTNVPEALDNADIIMVCVGTPSRRTGELDLSALIEVVETIGSYLHLAGDYPTIVIRSTMLPGTLRRQLLPRIEAASHRRLGEDFDLVHCPEFLRETTAVADFYNPPFSVVGILHEDGGWRAAELFNFLSSPMHVVAAETAEALKYACNAFHALKVVFTNEIARVLDGVGIDPRPVMDLFVKDDSLNLSSKYLRPGFAFGGSCLPKDVAAFTHLARQVDQSIPMLSSILPSNNVHIEQAIERVLSTAEPTVALLGLSFKAGTDDVRESPYVKLVEGLLAKGLQVRIYDPSLRPGDLVGSNLNFALERLPHLSRLLVDDLDEALESAGCLLLGTQGKHALSEVKQVQPRYIIDVAGELSWSEEEALRSLPGKFIGVAW